MKQTILLAFVLLSLFALHSCAAVDSSKSSSSEDSVVLEEGSTENDDAAKVVQSSMRLFGKFFHLFKEMLKDQDVNVLFKGALPASESKNE